MGASLRTTGILIGALALLISRSAISSAPTTQPRTGHFTTSFTDRSPHSDAQVQSRRHRIEITDHQRYDLSDESFEVFVPKSYDGERPFGLLVWVSPSPSGRLPPMWEGALEKHNLIWIGANNSGNDRGVAVRFGLALDAVHNLTRQYAIDESRIYVAGFSGGGKVASMLPIIYPEVFDGAIAMGGTGFYRPIPIPDRKNLIWPRTFAKPPAKVFARARTELRLVLLIGTEDFNYQQVKATHETGFAEDKFEHATLLEIPGLEHRLADESWIEQSILQLDEPLIDRARDELQQADELAKAGKFSDAYRVYLAVSMHGGETFGVEADERMAELFEKARLELVTARRAAESEQYAEAADLLVKLRETYGPAAPPEAEALMRELESNPASAEAIRASRAREADEQREAEASAALEIAQALVERDARRAYESLQQIVRDYPDTTAATSAAAASERLLADPKARARIQTDPKEADARKLLVLADNYRRNRLYAKARERLEELVKKYPNTRAADEARAMLEQIKQEERSGR